MHRHHRGHFVAFGLLPVLNAAALLIQGLNLSTHGMGNTGRSLVVILVAAGVSVLCTAVSAVKRGRDLGYPTLTTSLAILVSLMLGPVFLALLVYLAFAKPAGPTPAPRALNLVASAVGSSNYSLSLVRDGATSTATVVFDATAAVDGRSALAATDVGTPIAGRTLGAFRTPTGLLVWNGRITGDFATGAIALPGRATFASDVMGRTLAIGSSGGMITAAAGQCAPDAMFPDCATSRRVTFAFGTALGSEPLLAADAVGNGVFAVGARIAGGVALTFLRSDPIENFGTSAFSVVVPTAVAPLVAAATDADIGVFSAPEGPAFRVTTGFGLAGMNRVRIGAVQLCMAPP